VTHLTAPLCIQYPGAAVRGEPSDLPNLVVDACHDLRTPLAAAFGFARTIERMGGVTGDNAMYLQQVIEATQELEQLIAALSAVAHGERGTLRLRPQPVDLGELTLEAAEGTGHSLERDVAAGMIETDPARAVTSLVWLAAPLAETPGAKDRAWHIATPDTVAFGPLAGIDAELFERDLRAYAGRRVLGLLGATVAVEGDRVTVRFPTPAT
jgi:His Kinase A (phospho-acceptor) domain